MNLYEHDCPNCHCLNSAGPRQWMAEHLIQTVNPMGLEFHMTDVHASYLRWTFAKDRNLPIFTQNQLTRWLRRQGVHIVNGGGKGNKLSGWSLH